MTEVQDVGQHAALLHDIGLGCPNSVRIVESPHPIGRYTCLMHVFGFTEKREYIAIADYGLGRVYAGADFAHWLTENERLTEVSQAGAQNGDLVVYFREGRFKHIGLWQSTGRVLSKWGVGYLYNHELFQVPESYGTSVKFYRGLSYEDAYDLFTEFAEENGIPFENADP